MRRTEGNVKVSVVVPAYNEADNIPVLMQEFSKMFSDSRLNGEVILVDDGSTDGTFLKPSSVRENTTF